MNQVTFSTCVVIVTYGSRLRFLARVIEAALAEDAAMVLVVDNGTDEDCRAGLARLQQQYGARLEVLTLPENTGSAGGFKAGLAHVLAQQRCEYVWLLDDDNVPRKGALAALHAHCAALTPAHPRDGLMLLSLRDRNKMQRLAAGLPVRRVLPRRSGFQGLHLPGLLEKLFYRLPGLRRKAAAGVQARVVLPYASYGGLFFHRDVLGRIGLPDERFFLYVDDREFTYRLTRQGGSIFLVPASRLEDIDRSWGKAAAKPKELMSDSDFRVYYSIRNNAYFNKRYWTDSRLMYALNMAVYCALMAAYALLRGRWARWRLIRRAIADGHAGRLGRQEGVGSGLAALNRPTIG